MTETKLLQANNFISKQLLDRADWRKPLYHFSAPVGWINDPNGLIFFQNKCHLFYQYNPYSTQWDDMHWGHAVSNDLLHWENLPVALAPDHDYDKSGVFSGSAIEKDGRLYLMYTGHVVDQGIVTETQNIAYSDDGIHFQKYAGNPVIDARQLPTGSLTSDFRDPKLFAYNDRYYAVVASAKDGHGQILLFQSEDLLQWRFTSTLLDSRPELGIMAECPDLFQTSNGHWGLVFSAIIGDGQPNVVHLASGDINWETATFDLAKISVLDQGPDFYAPQSFAYHGKRILIPWLRNDRLLDFLGKQGHTWNGQMGIPRQLSIVNDVLYQEPFLDLPASYDNQSFVIETKKPVAFAGKIIISSNSGLLTGDELIFDNDSGDSIRLKRQSLTRYELNLHLATFTHQQELTIADPVRIQKLDILIDNSSLEIFINQQVAASFVIYPKSALQRMSYQGSSCFIGRKFKL
ncbi:MAG: GH32 C-terminal domain-containing protein [Oenococcus sp.]|uniref:glycoside hydrolase family 32 protein n=1 Tax=Oenococcus sp. TaxID=1979414 RepID=UPI0039EBF398